MDQAHWDEVYARGPTEDLGWYEPEPSTLGLVTAHSTPDDSVIDVGGGDNSPPLQAGDANMDLSFNQLDLVQVQVAAKYLTGQAATWGEGDWNAAPGGGVAAPPAGDGLFNQLDIVAASQAGLYLTGSYAARGPGDDLDTGVFDSANIELASPAQPAGGMSVFGPVVDAVGTSQNGSTPASVPEPSAITLAILACWPLAFGRRRQRGRTRRNQAHR